jgi:hypothetical protein
MKIIFKQNEDGHMCFFDTRSEKFLEGCCVKDEESQIAKELLKLANQVANKPFKKILEIAQSWSYNEHGYNECKFAKAYVKVNPDLKEKVLEKLSKPKVNKKMVINKTKKKTKKA